jgi:hypothetical protein
MRTQVDRFVFECVLDHTGIAVVAAANQNKKRAFRSTDMRMLESDIATYHRASAIISEAAER